MTTLPVIPAKAGIHTPQWRGMIERLKLNDKPVIMDPSLRRDDIKGERSEPEQTNRTIETKSEKSAALNDQY